MNPPAPGGDATRRLRRRTCDDVAIDWLGRRDRGLSAREEAELAAWIATDPAHGAALARFAAAWATMDRPRKTGAADKVLFAASRHAAARRRTKRRLGTLGAVGCLALVAFFAIRHQPAHSPEFPANYAATMLVPRQDVMPDGSLAQLKDGSQIALSFGQRERHVNLVRGTAHFEVVKDPGRPFVVTAGEFAIRAVGTAFTVQIAGDGVQVVVTEGKVAVERRSVDGFPPPAENSSYVIAGQRMDLVREMTELPAAVVVSPTELSAILAWREPRLEFSGTPLVEAVAILNQRNQVKLRVADPTLAAMQVSGVFRADNIEEFVLVLESGFGVVAERRDSGEIILRKLR